MFYDKFKLWYIAIIIIVLNKHQSIIIEEDLSFYKISTREVKSLTKTESEATNNYLTSIIIQTLLFDYLFIVDFDKKRKIIDDKDEEEEELYGN